MKAKKKSSPSGGDQQESNPLINSWTTHYLMAASSPVSKFQGGVVNSTGSPGEKHAVFGMSSSDYTFCRRRDPALNSKVLQMIAARRPNTSHGTRGGRGVFEDDKVDARGRPGTAGGGGGRGKKGKMTKEQQANVIKRLAEYHVEKFVPKEKSMGELRGGKQIMYSKFDAAKMNAVRERQKQYTRQLDESAGDKISLQIDSVTRAVVQQFRKLINSERCALFLHDQRTNELYFKPVGGLDTKVQEIRFPASAGIAGWVATKGKMLNIPNAYKDKRFNPAIDKETGFRTRSILCMPVTEADGTLLGVCQMVNKFEQMKNASATSSGGEVREKKYVAFKAEDEALLSKCCRRVAEALSALRQLQKQVIEDDKKFRKEEAERRLSMTMREGGGTGGTDSGGNSGVSTPVLGGPNTPNRRGSRTPGNRTPAGGRSVASTPIAGSRQLKMGREAKAEVKNLITFMSSEMSKVEEKQMEERKDRSSWGGGGVNEAASKFQFRDAHGPQITSKGQTLDAQEKRDAANKYKRKKAYTTQIQDGIGKGETLEAAMNSSLRNLMAKFKSMLNCERCGLFFLDDETDELYFHVEEEGQSIRFPKTAGIAGSVACSGEGLLIPDAYKDPRFNKAVDKLTGFRTRNILCQPIFDGMGAVIGVMQMVNSDREKGFSGEDVEKIGSYAKKMAQGLTAIRDSGKDRNSAHMQETSMAKIEEMNRVIGEIHREVDEEKKAYFAKRREESRHEYTAKEAAARFQFRDGGGEEQKVVMDDEEKNILKNKKMMEDIFSGKGINIEVLEKEKKEKLKEQKKMRERSGSVTAGIGGTLDLAELEKHLHAVVGQGVDGGTSRMGSRRGSVVGGGTVAGGGEAGGRRGRAGQEVGWGQGGTASLVIEVIGVGKNKKSHQLLSSK